MRPDRVADRACKQTARSTGARLSTGLRLLCGVPMTTLARPVTRHVAAAFLMAASSLLDRPLAAQSIVVQVTAEDGTPIARAGVEFWAKTRRVLSVVTREDGRVTVDRKKVRALTSVSA